MEEQSHTCRKSCAADTMTSSPASSRACWTSIWSAALLSKTLPSSFCRRSAAPLRKHRKLLQRSLYTTTARAQASSYAHGHDSLLLDCHASNTRNKCVHNSPGSARAVARAEVGENQVPGAQLRGEGTRHARRAVRCDLRLARLRGRECRLVRKQVRAEARLCRNDIDISYVRTA